MLTEKTLTTQDGSIHYAEGEPGGIPLVLLHGIYGRWHNLLPMMPSLALRYHLFAPDLRGHGKSGWTPGAYGLRIHTEDIRSLLSERVGQPAVLVGHSLGGAIALATAAFAPEMVRAVVAVDPPLGFLTDDQSSIAGVRVFFGALRDMLAMDGADTEKLAVLAKLLPALDPLTLRRLLTQLKQFDPEQLTWSIEGRSGDGLRLEDFFPQIACPVLLVQCNPALGGLLDEQIAQATTSLIADCIHIYRADVGHSIPTEQPTALAQMVTDFVEMLYG